MEKIEKYFKAIYFAVLKSISLTLKRGCKTYQEDSVSEL